MSTLNEYLAEKRLALEVRHARLEAGEAAPHTLSASVRAEGRSGVRRIRIRDFQVLSDSGPDFAGYNLGPSSPELQLGVLRPWQSTWLGSGATRVMRVSMALQSYGNARAITGPGALHRMPPVGCGRRQHQPSERPAL